MDVKRVGKRWVGKAEGKQRSHTDGPVRETLTVGPKTVFKMFERKNQFKKGNIYCWLLSEHWGAPSMQLAVRSKENML